MSRIKFLVTNIAKRMAAKKAPCDRQNDIR